MDNQTAITLKDIRTSDYEIGLTKLIGKKVKEVHGYISFEFGESVFKVTVIEFEDCSRLSCEGEHDFPYLVEMDKQPNFDDETLERLYNEEPE